MITYLLLFLLFLILSAFFSSAETAFTGLNKDKIEYLSKKGSKKATTIKKIIKHPGKFLATILVGNTLVNTALASLFTYIFSQFIKQSESSVLYSTIITTTIILIFSEVTPKSFAAVHPEKLSFYYVHFVRFFRFIFSPVVSILNFITSIFIKRVPFKKLETPLIDEEILTSWLKTKKIDMGSTRKKKFYLRFFSFFRKRVKEVMIPRDDVITIEINTPLSKVMSKIKKYNFTRYPVFEDKIDNVKGILTLNDFLHNYFSKNKKPLKQIIRETVFIPEYSLVINALEMMKKDNHNMSIIVDEFGNFEGIVTFEDIFEELMGEIKDQKDRKPKKMIIKNEKGLIVHGKTNIRDLEIEIPDINLPLKKDYSTISGFILDHLGKIPEQGEKFEYNNYLIKIIKLKHNKINKVLMEKLDENSFKK